MFGCLTRFLCGTGLILILAGCSPDPAARVDDEKNKYFQIGKSLVNSLDYPGAVKAFEKALETNPHSAAAHFELGVLYYQQVQDYAAAIYHFEKYLQLVPQAPHADNVRQFIVVCKQELAKTVSLGPVAEKVLRDLEDFKKENTRLKQELELWQARAHAATNAEANPAPNPVPPPALARPTNEIAGAASAVRGLTAPRPAAQRVGLPPPSRSHVVRSGETLSTIARRHQVSLTALQAANPGVNPRKLHVGQTLKIPGR